MMKALHDLAADMPIKCDLQSFPNVSTLVCAAGGAARVPGAAELLGAGQEPRHQDYRERDHLPWLCQVS